MRKVLSSLLFLFSLHLNAQQSDFAKNYVGVFVVTGYYTDILNNGYYRYENGVDFKGIGLSAARRLVKNLYVQTNIYTVNRDFLIFDLGVKVNALVHHKLQPFAIVSAGNAPGFDRASNFYYGIGLDWHLAPMFVLNTGVTNDFLVYTQGVKFGATYKF